MGMRALTLTQPWATLVALGAKTLETRSWRTDYRGPLAIHAAKGLGDMDLNGLTRLCRLPDFARALGVNGPIDVRNLPRGAIVAVCDLADCLTVPVAGITRYTNGVLLPPADPESSFGDFSPGRCVWRLQHVRALDPPFPMAGRLGLWTVEAEIVEAIWDQLDAAPMRR